MNETVVTEGEEEQQTVLAAFRTGNPDIVDDVVGVIRTLYPKIDLLIKKEKSNEVV